MRIMKRILSSVLAIAMLLTGLPLAVFAEESNTSTQSGTSISNDYMEFSVNQDTGFFSISTLEGHPQKAADNNMPLLYDGDSIETSFTTVRIDGKDYIFGQSYGIFGLSTSMEGPTVDAVNNVISRTWTIHGISVTEKAQLSRTDNTSTTGSVRLSYTVVNNSDTQHTVGIRVMLDNSLGSIDAPITMTQKELAPVSKEAEFFVTGADGSSRDPGMYVRYIDSYETPTKEAYITFSGLETQGVSRMIVGHWYHLASSKWECTPDTDLAFDSGFNMYGTADTATALYWDETTLDKENTVTRSVTYGVGDFTADVSDAKFNISLGLVGELVFNDAGEYENDIYEATLKIYNNVDGSVDIQNAVLSLRCDDGLLYRLPADDGSYVYLNEYTAQLGFIAAGTVETYTFQVRVTEQTELTPLEVVATVRGNTEDDTVRASQYILAPGREAGTYSVNVQKITDENYHYQGHRTMIAFGTFPSKLMEDRTLWAAAFVNTQDSSIRYEIDTSNIIVADNRLTIQYTGDMVIGKYCLELSFYGALEEAVGNVYTSAATFNIVNNPALESNQYNYVVVYRTGMATSSKYHMQSLNSDVALEAFKAGLKEQNTANNENVAEAILVLKGSFEAIREDGQIIGYSAREDFTVNDVVTGKADSTVEYTNFRASDQDSGTYVWDSVILNGAEEARTKTSTIFDCDWFIELNNYIFYSLSSDNVRIKADGVAGGFLDFFGGLINLKYGVFGKNEKFGNYISFGGSFTLTGYQRTEDGGYATTARPDTNATGFDAAAYSPNEKLKVNKKTIYASAAIDDVIFNKDGYCGVDTTVEIGVGAASILGTSTKETFSLMLHINTFDWTFGGEITVFIQNTYTVVIGLELKPVMTINGKILAINSINANVSVPPTAPLQLIPPYVGLTSAGFAVNDLLDAFELIDMEPQEAVAAVSSLTSYIRVQVGLILLQVLQATGILEFSPNHFTVAVTFSSPAVPGIAVPFSSTVKWRVAVKDADGNIVSMPKVSLALSLGANIFNILILNGTASMSSTLEAVEEDGVSDVTTVTHGGLQVYGCVKFPATIPVIGGVELLNCTGIINDIGVSVVACIGNAEINVSYGWEDENAVFTTYAAGEGEDEYISFSNMQVLVVEEVTEEESASAFSLRRAAAELPNMTSYITSVDGANALIAVRYTGEHPDVDGLTFTIDGEEYPLTASTAENNYSDGNCAVIADADGDGGRLIICVKEPGEGKKTYKITSTADLTFTGMEAIALRSSASAKSVAVNADDITVTADRSLKGSTVKLYYTASPELYENIRTEMYEEDGETKVRVYSVDADGNVAELNADTMQKISEHCVYTQTVEEDSDTITVPRSALDVDENMASGDYYVMAVVISANRKITRVYDKTSVISHINPYVPKQVAAASLKDIGDEQMELVITDCQDPDYEGYYISVYDADGEYLVQDAFYLPNEVITLQGEAGKAYQAEIYTTNTVTVGDEVYSIDSVEAYTTDSLTLHEPQTVEITSFVLEGDTVSGPYTSMNVNGENETITVDYIIGNKPMLVATTAENVQGAFVIDGMETAMNAADDLTNRFYYSDEFDEGLHTVSFRAVNAKGDSTVTDVITFAVQATEPSILVESAIVPVQDGAITIRGVAYNTDTLTFEGKTYTPAADGSFEITEAVSLDRFAQRYTLTATGPSDLTATSSVLAIENEYEPISSVDILVNGESVDKFTAAPGETLTLSVVGYADGVTRDVSDGATLSVVKGNNVAVLDGNTLQLTSAGTAFVKLTYDMGTYILDDRTENYCFEDMVEITVANYSSDVVPSIPNGATVSKGTDLTLSGNGKIYYTTDGSEPTTESTLYTGPITLNKSVTLKARCYEDGCIAGEVVTLSYTVKTQSSGSTSKSDSTTVKTTITSSVTQKTVDTGYPVELSIDGDGVIYYTTDGTTPNKNSTRYTSPIYITDDTVIKAVVWNEGDVYSKVYTFTYKVNARMVKPSADAQKSLLLCGYPDGTFRPDASITRAEGAVLLRRASDLYGYYVRDDVFTDVDMWAKQSILELTAAGVVQGYPDGTFRPDNTITRAEFIAMLMRVVGEEGGNSKFADVQGHWAEKYIAKATEYGYIDGYPDGSFRPDANITRAEALKVIAKVFGFASNSTYMRFTDVANTHWAFGYIAD